MNKKQDAEGKLAWVIEALHRCAAPIITSHVSPDGDAVGSVLGLYHYCRAIGKQNVTCALHDPVPDIYRWLPGVENIVLPNAIPGDRDLLVILDTHQRERTGAVAESLPPGIPSLIIDHHLVHGAKPENAYIDSTAAGVGELIAELFQQSGVPLTKEAAVCCYVALATDTGCFRYSNTTARAHRNAAVLVAAGVDVADVTERVFDRLSPAKFALMVRVLDRTQLHAGGQVATTEITLADINACQAQPEDTDGLINFSRNIEGVQVAVLFREAEPGKTKVSFRARPGIDAAKLAQHFGGGGHAAAAGVTIARDIAGARAAVLDLICGSVLECTDVDRHPVG